MSSQHFLPARVHLVGSCLLVFVVSAAFAGESQPVSPNPLRPATVTWGGYAHNEQIAGSAAQWPFVAKYMDAFLMHGAYWLSAKDEASKKSLQSLGEILQKNRKSAHLETGFGELESYNPSLPTKRQPYVRAQSDIAKFQEFRDQYGIHVSKVRVDWFPMTAMGVYARYYKTTDMRKLMAMVTGAREFGPVAGFDMKNAHWVEYGRELQAAFPGMEIAFDQALCNHGPVSDPGVRKVVPWKPFGFGYQRQLKYHNGAPIVLDGKPVEVTFDFADQLNGVISSSRDNGINFIGFEGDTPFSYFSANLPAFPNGSLVRYLLAVERHLHQHNLKCARIINDSGKDFRDGDRGWIQVDFGALTNVNRVRLVWGKGFATKAIVTTSSDGKVWENAKNLSAPVQGASATEFKPRPARFVKVEFRQRGTPNGYQVAEFEVYGPAQPGVNVALRKRVVASSVNPAHPSTGRNRAIPELVDGNPGTYWESDCLTNDAWDRLYHDRTLEYLEFYQAAGGRADEYIAESWYDGPFTLFPETKAGTFSNLARDLIRRLKGIDDDGSLMKLGLAVRGPGAGVFDSASKMIFYTLKPGETREFEVQVRNHARALNPGDARSTPLLRVDQKTPAGLKLNFATPDKKDITDEILAQGDFDGHYLGGLEPGETKTILARFSLAAGAAAVGNVKLKLYWNPQDPQSVMRDSLDFILK